MTYTSKNLSQKHGEIPGHTPNLALRANTHYSMETVTTVCNTGETGDIDSNSIVWDSSVVFTDNFD